MLENQNIDVEIINARFLKPFDTEKVKTSIIKTKKVITIEDGTNINGLASAVKELIIDENLKDIKFKSFAYPDEFIKHGKVNELEEEYGLDSKSICEWIQAN